MAQESYMEGYQKPELIHIDDPAFNEAGPGQWVVGDTGGNPNGGNGNDGSNNGNGQFQGNPYGIGGNGPGGTGTIGNSNNPNHP